MIDILCPRCGHRALRVATRCPRCGHEFPPELLQPFSPPHPRALPRLALMLGGAATAALVVAALLVRGRSVPDAAPTAPGPSLPAPRAEKVAMPSDARSAPAPAPTVGPPLLRYATTWINVRAYRGMGGAAVRVIDPGEAVTVDSLAGGWYRVLDRGTPVGYAHRSFLTAQRPAARPDR